MQMRKTILAASALVLLLATAVYAQDEESTPGAKIIERSKADALLLLPQAGSGGSDKVPLEHDEQKQTEFAIDVEGCEKLKGHVSVPVGLDKSGKYGMVLALNGSGYEGVEDLQSAARLSSGRDPLIVVGLTYASIREVEDGFSVIEPLVENDKLMEALTWLVKKAIADNPVDPDRVFLYGDSGAAADLALKLWEDNPDSFPFRACMYDGPMFGFKPEKAPPVPTVFLVTDWDLEIFAESDFKDADPAIIANKLMARGVPCEYHTYKVNFFAGPPERPIQIHRAAINRLGGPGAEEYPPEEGRYLGAQVDADKVPFEEGSDPRINEIVLLAKNEQWKQAWKRGNAILDDKSIKNKDKRDVKSFMKDFEKYCKDELERLNKSIQSSIEHDFWPNTWHHERMKAMREAFKEESWFQKKDYATTLETLKTYGPAKRDEARRVRMLEAVKLELDGKRDEAKKIYNELVKQKTDDGGVSLWPHAAAYRLEWWRAID